MHPLLVVVYSLSAVWFYIVVAEAGYCWFKVNKNGRCTIFFGANISHQECCSDNRANTAWTSQTIQPGQLFYLTVLGGGVPCEPCKDSSCDKVRCPGKRTCLLDQYLQPHCVRCRKQCPVKKRPRFLCGSDNITYTSLCELRRATCKKGGTIKEIYKGRCKANATCETIRCHQRKTCLLNLKTRLPTCVRCPMACPWVKSVPICATNNQTYLNWCQMMIHSCQTKVMLETTSKEACSGTSERNHISIHTLTYQQ
ncbi:follistatin-like isoform X2 [Limulus polyphemus]|uniref:Follistatin-like isoform X2 n=1 Tax=Limulus polyphemus TaxID=6850 RepID=A0ABM1T0I7_LIMPO|nr:follistatin-like isoform X2 [Limulus polyphemus]